MRRDFQPTIYLLAKKRNGALYTGVTSDLIQRIHQHREGSIPGFTRAHNIKRLVWFEQLARWNTPSPARSASRADREG